LRVELVKAGPEKFKTKVLL